MPAPPDRFDPAWGPDFDHIYVFLPYQPDQHGIFIGRGNTREMETVGAGRRGTACPHGTAAAAQVSMHSLPLFSGSITGRLEQGGFGKITEAGKNCVPDW